MHVSGSLAWTIEPSPKVEASRKHIKIASRRRIAAHLAAIGCHVMHTPIAPDARAGVTAERFDVEQDGFPAWRNQGNALQSFVLRR